MPATKAYGLLVNSISQIHTHSFSCPDCSTFLYWTVRFLCTLFLIVRRSLQNASPQIWVTMHAKVSWIVFPNTKWNMHISYTHTHAQCTIAIISQWFIGWQVASEFYILDFVYIIIIQFPCEWDICSAIRRHLSHFTLRCRHFKWYACVTVYECGIQFKIFTQYEARPGRNSVYPWRPFILFNLRHTYGKNVEVCVFVCNMLWNSWAICVCALGEIKRHIHTCFRSFASVMHIYAYCIALHCVALMDFHWLAIIYEHLNNPV